MKLTKIVTVTLISAFILSGCGASTQTKNVGVGAGVGAVAGGVLGGVIGHQSGNKKEGAIIGAVAGTMLGAFIGQRMSQQTEELEKVPGVENVNYDQEQQKIEARMKILFDWDKSEIKPSEAIKLDELAQVFSKYPENVVSIEGHTDSDGTDEYNKALSDRRASSVELYLRRKNLGISSLSSVGYGESMPIASNSTAAGKAQNRRVEIKITVDQNRAAQLQQQSQGQGTQQLK
ncbi:outer membrane protein/peptidoglycan-associated (lipo)protein [Beggiatoa alba B18LD]|uniref:Outer membrane protein/peptidoglycan-associated (Lipo)protein n=1 Tax=Beggiatoa alba B18LD TaxID=395493 RepID=I3CDE5_9GAMM|nr:OmpA family protein [Beggiatoa alba]EIJ41638.1 outer membrane protein/peptidoglycan-associated (lipo)protein [Beggiatoa alba B18LD]